MLNKIQVKRRAFHTLQDTNQKIKEFAFKYQKDTEKFLQMSIREFFNFVACGIDYQLDPSGVELIQRPMVTIRRRKGDCDCKTVLFLSWLIGKKYPCGFSVVSSRKDKKLHHVFPFIIVNDKIYDLDATYKNGKIYESKNWTKRNNYIIYKGVN